jgi:HAD superfamily hydrolase (TIGR01484 family)
VPTIKFFSIDIDGCLNSLKNKTPNIKKLNKIRNFFILKKDRFSFTLCTGRGTQYGRTYARILECPNPVVCENGGVLYYPLIDVYEFHPFFLQRKLKSFSELETELTEFLKKTYPGYKKEKGKKSIISLNPPNGTEIFQFFDSISSFVMKNFNMFSITRSQSAVDISLKNIDKNEGLQVVLNELHLKYSEVCGIGDSINDLSILTKVAFPTCPKNADDQVKEICKYVASKNYEEGTLEILSLF